MSEIIPIKQTIYNKNNFPKVVDTSFRELYNSEPVRDEIGVEEFFRLYEELFLDVSKEGDIESHRYILNKEAEYLGVKFSDDIDIQALLQEITDLRRQLVTLEYNNNRLTEYVPISELTSLENQQILEETNIDSSQLYLIEEQKTLAEKLLKEIQNDI